MHVSLDSALGRQRRLNQIGDTISSISTPTAAYSLRSLTGGDPKIVRVRRGSDLDEQDFTASEVASGAMLSYVNTQAIKPLDIKEIVSGTSDDGRNGDFILANAAYSLRSLGTRQATIPNDAAPLNADTVVPASGKYVLQARRNVDGNIKSFTADEVSDGTLASFVNESFTSSLPLDVQSSAAAAYSLRKLKTDGTSVTSSGETGGDTTGLYVVQVRRSSDGSIKSFTADQVTNGDLLSFVNEDLGITFGTAEATTNGATLTNASNTGFTYTSSDTNVRGIRLPFSQPIPPGATISVTITTSNKTSGMTPSVKFARDAVNQLGDAADPVTLHDDSTGTQTLVGKTTSTTTSLAFFDDVAGSFDISNVTINSIVYDGFVKTWYDQSGNDKHATQTTPANQPKIVENGSFLTPGVKFEGAQTLSASNPIITAASTGDNSTYSAFSVQTVATSEAGYLYGNASGTNGTSVYAESNTFTISNSFHTTLDDISRSSGQNLLSAVYNSGDAGLQVNGAGTMTDSGTYNFSAGSSNFIIGNRNSSSSDAAFLTGSINEIIVYNSNQSEGRRAIEESISGHYGITLGSFSRDGFVRTWYDQSVSDQAGTTRGNHATQTDNAKQPTIVSNGSLLTDGILFDENINLPLSGDGLDIFKNVAHGNIFSIIKPLDTGTSGDRYFSAGINTGTTARFLFADGKDTSTNATFRIGGKAQDSDGFSDEEGTTTHSNAVSLLTGFINYGTKTGTLFLNGSQIDTGTLSSMTAGNTSNTQSTSAAIGDLQSSGALTSNFNCQEMIIYNTDQTNNRTAIEANIGSAHGIDLPDGFDPTNDKVNGFVVTWYDQFGTNDATQPTSSKQPKIVNAGNLITGGGIDFDGSNDQLDFTALNASDLAILSVLKFDAVSSQKRILGDSSDNSEGFGIGNATNGFFRGNGGSSLSPSLGATISTSGDFLYSLTRASNTITFFTKGTASGTNTRSDAFKADSIGGSTNPIDGKLKEIIIYTSEVQTSTREALETNITSHYEIS